MMAEAPSMEVMNEQQAPAEVPDPSPAEEPVKGSFHQDRIES